MATRDSLIVASGPAHLPASLSARTWWTAVIYIAAVAMFLRFYDLPLKPLHHDEGVNTLILTSLVQPPHTYRYDPENYHGPTLFYFSWLSIGVFGLTTEAIRIVTAAAGLLVVLLVLGWKGRLGSVGAISASVLLALSPGAVYFSRDYIHEMLLVCFTLATVSLVWTWCGTGKALPFVGAAACAALMFATKETAIISAVVLCGAIAGVLLLVRGDRSVRQVIRSFADRARQKRSLAIGLLGVGVFTGVLLLFYTSLFSHWQGAIDAVRTFAFWTSTGTRAHTRPWTAYLDWLAAEEMPILVLGTAGIAVALWRRDNPVGVFSALWALGSFAVYSAIPYKTPWLVLNLILPLAIAAGYIVELVWTHRRKSRAAVGSTFAALAGFAAFQSAVLNFVEYDNDRHPYVYAHTYRDVLWLVDEIRTIEARNPRSPIAVTSRDHFPLSWYLREFPAGYYGREIVTGDPLVIASVDQQSFFDRALGARYRRRGEYRLRPGVRLVLYARRDLRR